MKADNDVFRIMLEPTLYIFPTQIYYLMIQVVIYIDMDIMLIILEVNFMVHYLLNI